MEAERTLPDEICRNPAKYMENGLSFTKDQKQDNSDRWLLAEGTKIVGRSATKVIDFVELFPNQNRGFGLIEKTSKVFDSDYILRIQLSAKEKGASVISYPIYQCIRAREQRTVMSLSWKPGFPVSSTTGARADGYLGVDLFFGYNVRLWGWYMLPGLTIGGVLGYSWTTRDGERAVLNYRAIEFRPHLDLELMRIPVASGISISLSGVLDIGIGANEYKYHSSIDRSGWSAVSLVGGGGKLSIRAPSVLQIGLSGIVQQRSHRSSIDGLSQSDPMIASDVTVAWLVFELMFRIRR